MGDRGEESVHRTLLMILSSTQEVVVSRSHENLGRRSECHAGEISVVHN